MAEINESTKHEEGSPEAEMLKKVDAMLAKNRETQESTS